MANKGNFYIDEAAEKIVDALVARKLADAETKPLRGKRMNRKKVYCSDCVHFRHVQDTYYDEWCICPINTCVKDTYWGTEKRYKDTPARLNEDNDCSWFVMRWWKRLFAGRSE